MPGPRRFPAPARRDDAVGEAPELLDQSEAQHDRDRPDFADRELGSFLVGDREFDERVEVDASGGVRDELARQHVDARVALIRPLGNLRQLAVVTLRQVLPDLANLILDDVVIVAQPVFGRYRLRVEPARGGEEAVDVLEPRGAAVQLRQERTAASRARREPVRGCDPRRVRLKLILTEDSIACGVS